MEVEFLDEGLNAVRNRVGKLQDEIFGGRQVDAAGKARGERAQIQFVLVPVEQHGDPVGAAPCNSQYSALARVSYKRCWK